MYVCMYVIYMYTHIFYNVVTNRVGQMFSLDVDILEKKHQSCFFFRSEKMCHEVAEVQVQSSKSHKLWALQAKSLSKIKQLSHDLNPYSRQKKKHPKNPEAKKGEN